VGQAGFHCPVLFRQKRVGRDRELFEIFKFRTMRQDAPHDVPTHELRDSARYITRSGRVLRKNQSGRAPSAF
jgi:O-antigen biosynthesis protein WbqP